MNEAKDPLFSLTATQEPTCGLGRVLDDCHLRAAGCSRLFDVLQFLYPPGEILDELRRRNNLTPAGRAWLRRLDEIW